VSAKLFALIDTATMEKKNQTLLWVIERVCTLGAVMIEYRNKTGSFEEKRDDILTIKEHLDTPVIVNDDISLVPFCDGLHLGQEDILKYGADVKSAIVHVREIIGSKILGISTHNEKEILEANETSIDYIGLGAYKKTDTKETDNILGDKLSSLALLSKKPVAAIGGVKLNDDILNAAYIVVGSGLYED
jgi:thiamine-phosphate pyrophosphorylase